MTVQFEGLSTFLLVFVRMVAMLGFNPLMQRRNVPRRVVTALALCLTFLLAPLVTPAPDMAGLEMAISILREVLIGFVCGLVFQIFYYLLFYVGDFMDMQFGLSMSKVMDPGTSIQASFSSNLLGYMFVLYFFATDSHLVMIRLFAASFDIIAVGGGAMTLHFAQFIIELFLTTFSLILRLILPFAIAEFSVEMAMGVLMRLIPQIHVFVINIQVKLLMALALLLMFAPLIGGFLDNYVILMLENMQRALFALAAG